MFADNEPNDNNGHGSHVTGIIAAQSDNAAGISGVAPDTRVIALRALDAAGSGYLSDIAAAFDYAGDLGIVAVNTSLGADGDSPTLNAVIAAHPGTLYVVRGRQRRQGRHRGQQRRRTAHALQRPVRERVVRRRDRLARPADRVLQLRAHAPSTCSRPATTSRRRGSERVRPTCRSRHVDGRAACHRRARTAQSRQSVSVSIGSPRRDAGVGRPARRADRQVGQRRPPERGRGARRAARHARRHAGTSDAGTGSRPQR